MRCDICNTECKNELGLKVHKTKKHGGGLAADSPRPPLPQQGEQETGSPALPQRITFHSPMSSGLRIVVKSSRWMRIVTPAGIQQELVPGKTVEFLNNTYVTDDPEIIDFLENKYKDERFPVFSERKLRSMGL